MAKVNVWDYFDFEPLGAHRTRLTQTVVLDMKNPFLKSVIDIAAFLSGNRREWERQFEEQLGNLAAFAEAAPAAWASPGKGVPRRLLDGPRRRGLNAPGCLLLMRITQRYMVPIGTPRDGKPCQRSVDG
ncbi:hypothetical protein H0Z60_16175 [Ectothiorhodospiraceae bacterium WFHF3C12]|nr:hypothetical protein [Ectothiorhodospiraceae bacterium WFHF3C12]